VREGGEGRCVISGKDLIKEDLPLEPLGGRGQNWGSLVAVVWTSAEWTAKG